MLEYVNQLTGLILKSLRQASISFKHNVVKKSTKLLRNIIISLTTIYPSIHQTHISNELKWHSRWLPSNSSRVKLTIDWHCPRATEIDCACSLIVEIARQFNFVNQSYSLEQPISNSLRRVHSVLILRLLESMTCLLKHDETSIEVGYCLTSNHERFDEMTTLRNRLTQLVLNHFESLVDNHDIESAKNLLKSVAVILSNRGIDQEMLTLHIRGFEYSRSLMNVGGYRRLHTPLTIVLKRIHLQHLKRLYHNSLPTSSSHENNSSPTSNAGYNSVALMDHLHNWSVGPYLELRVLSQSLQAQIFKSKPQFKLQYLSRVFAILQHASPQNSSILFPDSCRQFPTSLEMHSPPLDHEIIGSLHLLTCKFYLNMVMRRTELVVPMMQLMCALQYLDKVSHAASNNQPFVIKRKKCGLQ